MRFFKPKVEINITFEASSGAIQVISEKEIEEVLKAAIESSKEDISGDIDLRINDNSSH